MTTSYADVARAHSIDGLKRRGSARIRHTNTALHPRGLLRSHMYTSQHVLEGEGVEAITIARVNWPIAGPGLDLLAATAPV